MTNRRKKYKKTSISRLLYFATIIVSLFSLFLAKHLWNYVSIKPKIVYHGPYLEKTFVVTESVLGDSTARQQIMKYVQTIDQSSPKSSSEAYVNKEYGIAAGWSLTRLSQKDLNLYFDNLQALGVKWVRWDIDWSQIQPDNSNTFKWEGPDRVVATSKRYGIKSLGIITYTPKWARGNVCPSDFTCQPANAELFGLFAGQVALRYKDSIYYWEIWNEPNVINFFGPKPSPEKYFDLLKAAYIHIKNSNSESIIITGGLAPSADNSGGISPITFISGLYELGFSKYSDGVALHPYTYPETPNFTTYWNSWQEMLNIRLLMINKGDTNKKIWVTEIGAPTGGPGKVFEANQINGYKYGTDFTSEQAQIQVMTEATDFYRRSTSSWMGPFFWYSLRDEGYSYNTPENHFGLLRRDWSRKNSFDVLKSIISKSNK